MRGVGSIVSGEGRSAAGGLAAGSPLHVLRTDPATNTVVAGPRESLTCSTVRVAGKLYLPVEFAEAEGHADPLQRPEEVQVVEKGIGVHGRIIGGLGRTGEGDDRSAGRRHLAGARAAAH